MDEIAKELRIRDRIMSIYNEAEAEFASPEEYDTYLETVEDIIYKLTNNIDVIEVEEQVRDYERRRAEKKAEAAGAGASAAVAAAYKPQAGGAAVQPQPLAAVQQDAEGKLLPQQGRVAMSRAQFLEAAAAGGWSPDIPKRRALHEAFTTIFVF